MREAPPGWLHGDRLHRVWGLVGDALERRSLEARGTVELRDLSREERHALSDVVGAPITGEAVRLKLADLDARLRVRTGRELAAVVTWLTGRSLVDRADRRRLAAARREEPFEAARQWLLSRITSEADRPEAAMGGGAWVEDWVEGWVDGLRRDGVLTTVKDGGAVLVSALEVLDDRGAFALSEEQVPARPVVARTELAARHTGSAHGLDDGTKVALLVLRAAAARAATSLPRTATDRRRLWESLGVVVDRVSATCLTWNLLGESARVHASEKDVVAGAARGPAPVHVTWWDLEAGLDLAPGQRVLVCENPRTLEAIAESVRVGPTRCGLHDGPRKPRRGGGARATRAIRRRAALPRRLRLARCRARQRLLQGLRRAALADVGRRLPDGERRTPADRPDRRGRLGPGAGCGHEVSRGGRARGSSAGPAAGATCRDRGLTSQRSKVASASWSSPFVRATGRRHLPGQRMCKFAPLIRGANFHAKTALHRANLGVDGTIPAGRRGGFTRPRLLLLRATLFESRHVESHPTGST